MLRERLFIAALTHVITGTNVFHVHCTTLNVHFNEGTVSHAVP